ncbi:hypothetical protein [Embleya sp. NPDC001921]
MTWIPPSPTLPTEEQPLRVAEFGAPFAETLVGVEWPEPTRARLVLDVGVEARAGSGRAGERLLLVLDVSVPAGRVAVLDALLSRAVEAAGIAGPATP